ncbi:MAG: ATP synthase F1 subunit epsilon [Coriobacteriaceae bacterium]|nr:ATP synthase F1 subunit epsilon [Coriobacteriaceae bacterium]
MALQCDIVTPVSKLFSGEIEFVVLPAAEGEMGIYEKHDPIVTTLNAGTVRVTEEPSAEAVTYFVAGGYAEIDTEHVIILADRAQAAAEVDVEAAQKTLSDLKERLAESADDDTQKPFLTSEIEWYSLLVGEN